MRIVAVLVLLAACYGHDESPPPTAVPSARPAPARVPVPKLICPQSAASGRSDIDPSKGGYRLVADAAQLQAVRAAMKAGTPVHSHERTRAIAAAVEDFRPELQACMVAADGSHPASQYELRVMITGNSVASVVEHVSLERIVGINADHSPIFTSTAAQACTYDLLRRLELPPGDMLWEFSTLVRQDFCTPTAVIALQATHWFVDAYDQWWRDHGGESCPARLEDLTRYGVDVRLEDPWGDRYVMRCNATGFQVISAGPDRTLGTTDDLESHR